MLYGIFVETLINSFSHSAPPFDLEAALLQGCITARRSSISSDTLVTDDKPLKQLIRYKVDYEGQRYRFG